MKIVLDTNIVLRDPMMMGSDFHQLINTVRVLDAQIVLPVVVVDEVKQKAADNIRKGLVEITRGVSHLQRWVRRVADEHLPYGRTHLIKQFESEWQDRLQEIGISVHAIPHVLPATTLTRILQRRKPFRGDERGYKDYLIWETVLELLGRSEGAVVFISADVKDFAEGSTLHRHLLDDLGRRRIAQEKLLFYTSLDDFFAANDGGALEPDLELLRSLRTDATTGLSVYAWANEVFQVDHFVPSLALPSLRGQDVNLPPVVERPEPSTVASSPERVRVVAVRRIPNRKAIVSLDVDVRVLVAFLIDEEDWDEKFETEYDVDVLERDEWGYLCTAERPVTVFLELIADLDKQDFVRETVIGLQMQSDDSDQPETV